MKKSLMLLAIAAVGLGSMEASALTNRLLPGMMCRKIDGDGIPFTFWEGKVANQSTTSTLRLSCPIVRDNGTAAPVAIQVNVVDANANLGSGQPVDVCCQFYSVDTISGNVSWANANICTNGSQTPNAQPLNPPSSVSFAFGTEFLFCSVPPQSGILPSSIVSYAVAE